MFARYKTLLLSVSRAGIEAGDIFAHLGIAQD